jgi:hypothetical protein
MEPNLVPVSFDILLNLSRVLSERERHVRRGLPASADRRVVGRAEEVGDGVPLRRRVGHHPVLHALVSVVAPCLQFKTPKRISRNAAMRACMTAVPDCKEENHACVRRIKQISFGVTLKCK